MESRFRELTWNFANFRNFHSQEFNFEQILFVSSVSRNLSLSFVQIASMSFDKCVFSNNSSKRRVVAKIDILLSR